jgi:hypothetical protein
MEREKGECRREVKGVVAAVAAAVSSSFIAVSLSFSLTFRVLGQIRRHRLGALADRLGPALRGAER